MTYKITHTTTYDYGEPVSICHNEARLTPRTTPRQKLVRSRLLVEPAVSTMDQDRDYFGNVVHYFALNEGHRTLEVTALCEVELEPYAQPELEASEPWDALRDSLRSARSRDALAALELSSAGDATSVT